VAARFGRPVRRLPRPARRMGPGEGPARRVGNNGGTTRVLPHPPSSIVRAGNSRVMGVILSARPAVLRGGSVRTDRTLAQGFAWRRRGSLAATGVAAPNAPPSRADDSPGVRGRVKRGVLQSSLIRATCPATATAPGVWFFDFSGVFFKPPVVLAGRCRGPRRATTSCVRVRVYFPRGFPPRAPVPSGGGLLLGRPGTRDDAARRTQIDRIFEGVLRCVPPSRRTDRAPDQWGGVFAGAPRNPRRAAPTRTPVQVFRAFFPGRRADGGVEPAPAAADRSRPVRGRRAGTARDDGGPPASPR
jgi:hypothetical protein